MAADEAVLVGVRYVLLLGEPLERLEHAEAGLSCRVEILETGLVGSRFLRAAFGQQKLRMTSSEPPCMTAWPAPPMSRPASPPVAAAPPISRMPRTWARKDLGLVAGNARAQGCHVAAGDVARLMGDDADELVWRFRLQDGARVDVDIAAVDDESVESVVAHDTHRDARRAEARGLENGARIVVEQVFDLGVADQWQALRRSLDRGHHDGRRSGRRCASIERAFRVLDVPEVRCVVIMDHEACFRGRARPGRGNLV